MYGLGIRVPEPQGAGDLGNTDAAESAPGVTSAQIFWESMREARPYLGSFMTRDHEDLNHKSLKPETASKPEDPSEP